MKRRCLDRNSEKFATYGGAGITVDNRWLESFADFLSGMGERPDDTTLDRIDNSKGYSRDNCRWATAREQCANRSTNVRVVYKGEEVIIADLVRLLDIKRTTLEARINRGWPEEDWGKRPEGSKVGLRKS